MFDPSLHSAQLMGVVNALRTGNPQIDMILALLLPFVIREVLKQAPQLWRKIVSCLKKQPEQVMYTRTITYRTSQNNNVDIDATSQNAQLIRAIQLYVHNNCQLDLKGADIDLATINNSKSKRRVMEVLSASHSNSLVGILETCDMVERPEIGTWQRVGCFAGSDVEIRTYDSASSNGQPGKGSNNDRGENSSQDSKTRTLEIRLKSQGGAIPIRKFLQEALDWYILKIKELDNKDRYFFDLQPFSVQSIRNGSLPSFRAFPLGDEKTFDTLFFQQKCSLLEFIDQFQAKKGRFACPGTPYKLGLLLSGPPGTGKTSLIKALAHKTGRHVANIPLSKVSSNTQLTNTFFNKRFVLGDDSPSMQLDFSKLIMVLEDVDCSSQIVKNRNGKTKNPKMEHASSLQNDPLDLSGLLNVLDGVVETPGRIVVMTTNHPEVLDPALTRSGRFNMKIAMGPLVKSDAILMTEHYYQTELSIKEKEQIESLFDTDGLEMTPAEFEQLVMEEDSVESLIAVLEDRASRSIAQSGQDMPDNEEDGAAQAIRVSSSEEEDDDMSDEGGQPEQNYTTDRLREMVREVMHDEYGDY